MQKSTVINTDTGTGYAKAAKIETAVKNIISTPENSNMPTKVTIGTWANMMISNTDIATGIRPDTTTATMAVRCALIFMEWTSVTIRTGIHVGMRTPTRTPGGDIPT